MDFIFILFLKDTSFSSLRVPWFLTCRLSDPDPFIFSEFSSDKSPHIKCWMDGSFQHRVLYFLCPGIGLFPYLQYLRLPFSLPESLIYRGLCYPCSHCPGPTLRIFFSYSNKHAIFATLRIPYNIPYIVFLVSNQKSPHETDLIKIKTWYLSHYACLPFTVRSTLL